MTRSEAGPEGSAVDARRVLRWTTVVSIVLVADAVVYILRNPGTTNGDLRPAGWGGVLLTNLASNALWVPFAVLAVWFSVRWPITTRPWHLAVHALALVVVIVGRAAGVWVLNPLVGWYEVLPEWREILVASLFNNLLIYVLVTGAAHAVYYADVARIRERQFGQARLDALAAQIQPHFLFNSLNAIVASVHDRPDVAEAMIVDLATLLRYSLDQDGAELVPLEDELDIAEAYLQIEHHRFADRLAVQWQVDPAARDAAVPPFLLQPLLENAVRHGLRPGPGRMTLTVHVERVGPTVELRVEDDGVGAPADHTAGVGTSNVAARLRHFYDREAGLTITPRPGAGTVATVRLPYRVAAAERLTA